MTNTTPALAATVASIAANGEAALLRYRADVAASIAAASRTLETAGTAGARSSMALVLAARTLETGEARLALIDEHLAA